MKDEFCKYCGAGIGLHRREGEGTCPKCAPKPPETDGHGDGDFDE